MTASSPPSTATCTRTLAPRYVVETTVPSMQAQPGSTGASGATMRMRSGRIA